MIQKMGDFNQKDFVSMLSLSTKFCFGGFSKKVPTLAFELIFPQINPLVDAGQNG